MDDIDLARLEARILDRVADVLRDELAAISGGAGRGLAAPTERSASPDHNPKEAEDGIDPVEYWVSIPEEKWGADTVDVGPPDGKLWLTTKQTEGEIGRGPTTVRALIQNYPVALMYGGNWSVNRYRAIAAMRGRLPKKKAEN